MAEELVTMVASTATLPVGTNIAFDGVTIGGTTGKVEYIKLMSGSSGSTVTVPASSAAIGAIGLNVSVTNSTGNPIGVALTGGQSSVSVVGNVNVTFSTASTGSVIVANTTAAPANVQIIFNSSAVSTATPFPVLLQGSTATVTIQGNSTVTVNNTTASAIPTRLVLNSTLVSTAQPLPVYLQDSTATVTIQGNATVTVSGNSTAVLSTVGMGGSTGNPMYTYPLPYFTAASTFASTTLTSTTVWAAFSSAGSTRFVITDIEVTNQGGTIVLVSIFDGSTSGTVIDRTYCATAGGGKVHAYVTPVYGTTGLGISVQQDAASTITVNLRGYRSS